MADPTLHPDFDLDTALSADLDGALDAYAAELGLPPDDMRAALAGPAATTRRAELAAVRTALGREPEPAGALDELTRRRLLAGAGVGADRTAPRRDRSWMLRAGAAAAVTLIVVGALYAVVRNSGGSDGSDGSAAKSGGGATSSVAAVTGDVGDLGAVDAAEIARLLEGDAAKTVPSTSGAAADRSLTTDSGAGTEAAVAPAAPAVEACAQQYAAEGRIRFRGRGTYQGRPAVVLGVDTARRTIVFVVAPDNCTQVLYSASR